MNILGSSNNGLMKIYDYILSASIFWYSPFMSQHLVKFHDHSRITRLFLTFLRLWVPSSASSPPMWRTTWVCRRWCWLWRRCCASVGSWAVRWTTTSRPWISTAPRISRWRYHLVMTDITGWWFSWNMTGWFSHILGSLSSQLTNSYFSEGLKPPTR